MKQNPPNKHHYIPCFYTRRWIDERDGKLLVFSRPYVKVIDRRKYPEETGFQEKLYALRGFDPNRAQQIEERFFKPLDGVANDALCEMERDGNRVKWTAKLRSGWSRFLISLLLRCPEDLLHLRGNWADLYLSEDIELENKYNSIKKNGDPDTFNEWLASRPLWQQEKEIFEIYLSLIDNKDMGNFLNEMYWYVFDTKNEIRQLFTSDRPIIHTNGLMHDNGHLVIPIGPHKLFIAVARREFMAELASTRMRDLVMECNRQIVGKAKKFVYAHGPLPSEIEFIREKFGRQKNSRLLETVIEKATNN